MKLATVMLACLLLFGCANRLAIPQPDGSITVHDRMIAVLNSDLPPEQKLALAQALLERENQQGGNLLSALKDYLSWLVAVGFMIAK